MSTTETNTYNGWPNYETWAVKLWMDNDESSYRHWKCKSRLAFRRGVADQHSTQSERATYDLADQLKNEFEDNNPLADTSNVFSDLLSAAISEVNWDEIARSMIEDLDETEDGDEESEEA